MHSDALILLSAADSRPMYQQIVDQITARVMAGDWRAGQALPSIRDLAATSGVSVITVKRAYEELERAGVIFTRHGKGSVVADRPEPARTLLEAGLHQHLHEAVAVGARLGLDRVALHQRLDGALDASSPSSSTKGTDR
jgi:GntR family transcriptional regulator